MTTMERRCAVRTLGILGGGQLGRMTALAARRLGMRVVTFEPDGAGCPSAPVSDHVVTGGWDDAAAVAEFRALAEVATYEFENVPVATARAIAEHIPLRPAPEALAVCQNREAERGFLAAHGFPQPSFRIVESAGDLAAAATDLGTPCVMKTLTLGYDGKGQAVIRDADEAGRIWRERRESRAIVEELVDFECELSVITARGTDGRMAAFPVPENIHTHGILDVSILPGRHDARVAGDARTLAAAITEALDVTGLLAVEMFLRRDGRLLVNEMAPRPHNSGHATLDACLTSQFEQHARAVFGLPLGDPASLRPAVMVNLLGDLWADGEPDWSRVLENPRAKLHLYGKQSPAPGRKMGHFCVLADSAQAALDDAAAIRRALGADAVG